MENVTSAGVILCAFDCRFEFFAFEIAARRRDFRVSVAEERELDWPREPFDYGRNGREGLRIDLFGHAIFKECIRDHFQGPQPVIENDDAARDHEQHLRQL